MGSQPQSKECALIVPDSSLAFTKIQGHVDPGRSPGKTAWLSWLSSFHGRANTTHVHIFILTAAFSGIINPTGANIVCFLRDFERRQRRQQLSARKMRSKIWG
jgi:hypothetical protein